MEEEPSWCQPAELVLDHAVWSSPGKQIWLKNTTGVNVNTERTQIRSQKHRKRFSSFLFTQKNAGAKNSKSVKCKILKRVKWSRTKSGRCDSHTYNDGLREMNSGHVDSSPGSAGGNDQRVVHE